MSRIEADVVVFRFSLCFQGKLLPLLISPGEDMVTPTTKCEFRYLSDSDKSPNVVVAVVAFVVER